MNGFAFRLREFVGRHRGLPHSGDFDPRARAQLTGQFPFINNLSRQQDDLLSAFRASVIATNALPHQDLRRAGGADVAKPDRSASRVLRAKKAPEAVDRFGGSSAVL
jgi:hypothetical protein